MAEIQCGIEGSPDSALGEHIEQPDSTIVGCGKAHPSNLIAASAGHHAVPKLFAVSNSGLDFRHGEQKDDRSHRRRHNLANETCCLQSHHTDRNPPTSAP